MKTIICLLLSLALLPLTHAEWKWETAPEWSFQVAIGGEIEFVCNDTDSKVMEGDVLQWHNPHGNMINIDSDKYMLMNHNNIPRMKLKVNNVQRQDSGVYICNVMRNDVHYMKVNRAVNLFEPIYENTLDQYRYNIMVGGIAAAAFFVALVGMCLIHRFRYMTDEEKRSEKEARDRRKLTHTQDVEAGPLPPKEAPRNGGQYNLGYESTNL